jgi:hypothetical protein
MPTKKISDLTTITPLATDLVALDRPTVGAGAPITGKATLGDAVAAITPTVTGTFNVPSPGEFVTTASIALAGGEGFSYTADSVGSDTYFFVSGALDGKDGASPGVAVFGGDTVVSGVLHALTTASIGDENTDGFLKVVKSGFPGYGTFIDTGAYPRIQVIGGIGSFVSAEITEGALVLNDQGHRVTLGTTFSPPNSYGQLQSDDILVLSGANLRTEGDSLLVRSNDGSSTVTAAEYGADNFLFVSGAIGSKDGSAPGVAVFGGDLHISGNLTVDGTSPGGGGGLATGKQHIASYATPASTASQAVGQFSWVPTDFTSLSSVVLRAVLATNGTVNLTGSLQVYNITSGSFLDLVSAPAVNKHLAFTGSAPTLFSSANLLAAGTNFDNSSTSVYEVRVSGSSANTVVVGGVELVFS